MAKKNLITQILNKTNHTIESIAEILDMDVEELILCEEEGANNNVPHYKIQLLSDFLDSYFIKF